MITAEGLSKLYTSHAAENAGKPSSSKQLWALRDISFVVPRGEAVGVIGENGAGKSTLLRILSGITEPTSGRAILNGRAASLLEIGAGFHPELSGMENIYLHGAILGMKRREIRRKIDAIIAFSELESFIGAPVKRYSWGMYMRLAFSVAAHLDSEILLVDEVFAVGDLNFQKKCRSQMDLLSREGRTILLVSHDISTLTRFCTQGLLIHEGLLAAYGPAQKTLQTYLELVTKEKVEDFSPLVPAAPIQITALRLKSFPLPRSRSQERNEPLQLQIEYRVQRPSSEFTIELSLERVDGLVLCLDSFPLGLVQTDSGNFMCEVSLPSELLNAGTYQVRVRIDGGSEAERMPGRILTFSLYDAESPLFSGAIVSPRKGLLALPLQWKNRCLISAAMEPSRA